MDPEQAEELTLLWTRAHPSVEAFISGMLRGNRADTEDVLQKTALAVVKKFDQYDRERPFLAWALGVARFEVLGHRRFHARNRLVLDDALIQRVADAVEQDAGHLADSREALRVCLQSVTGRAREAIDLRYSAGLGAPVIAERLDVSPGALRVLLHRTRATLRRCIERRLGGAHA